MPVRNLDWYSLNSERAYPVDEGATLLSDAGELLPNDIIVDLHLAIPDDVAKFAFIGSISVTAGAVSLVIMGSGAPAQQSEASEELEEGSPVPLAAISVAKSSLQQGRHYALTAMTPGVGGWIVFGSGATNKKGTSSLYYKGKFTSPAQSCFVPKAVYAYKKLPIPYMARHNEEQTLSGIIRLKGGSDMEIVKETIEIEGDEVEAIVFRLKNKATSGEGRNVFEVYSGPCAARPETGNCDGDPIEQLNAAVPDCCGRLTLNFTGCASITPTEDGHGIVVDCAIGMSDICGTDKLPDSEGNLPNEKDSDCE